MNRHVLLASIFSLTVLMTSSMAEEAVPLPAGVKAVWDHGKAERAKSPTRERICLNGLWRWQPAKDAEAGASMTVPSDSWGYFKVPGSFRDSTLTMFAHPSWTDDRARNVTAAWYQREITVPKEWAGRRITFTSDYLNSLATIYVDGKEPTVDGKPIGPIHFPGGEADITSVCRPGEKQMISALVFALPMEGVMLSYADSASPKAISGQSPLYNRGFCGDVYLIGSPAQARIADVKVCPSYRNKELSVVGTFEGLQAETSYALRVRVMDEGKTVKEFTGKPFTAAELKGGRMEVTGKWLADKLWDTHTPQNMYHLELSLLDGGGKELDVALPVRFGYRELWIDGRDFRLNGSRLFFSAIPLQSACGHADLASYEKAKAAMLRMKTFGINFVYTGNFDCLPGAHLSYEEVLRAADDVGMLISFTQPHMGGYDADWRKPVENDLSSNFARHVAGYVRMTQNHPSVIVYSMNHNAGGYPEDMHPDKIDGKYPRKGIQVRRLLRSEAIVKHFDPTRVVYHHAGGDLGDMHTSNFYSSFVPIQELSDWFAHWGTEGVKPYYSNEYGGPLSWDWTMYRGYYKGSKVFGSAAIPWEFSVAEWNSQVLGDAAFQLGEYEKANLRFEGRKAPGEGWHRWDYKTYPGDPKFHEVNLVQGMYLADNFRAYRTWGVTGISPWEHSSFWMLRAGADTGRKSLPVDWENLQRPGFNADFSDTNHWSTSSLPYHAQLSDWITTPSSQALLRNNMPLLAYIGGKAAAFTSKDHNAIPGEAIDKQLIIINNSRVTMSCDCTWSLALPQPITGSKKVSVPTGEQERIPLSFPLPAGLAAGTYPLTAKVTFANGEIQEDTFAIHVLAPPQAAKVSGAIALFDPKGETTALLKELGVTCQNVDAAADLSAFDTLIVGKAALTVDGAAPDIARVRDGLKVIMFEQTTEVLEQRFGFRTAEYGLRNVYKRVADHPLLAGLEGDHLRDWRGSATILPAQLKTRPSDKHDGTPSIKWCGMVVTKLWRAGCRGNVASVLIEKPARGDFLTVVDGGFSLQYSPLMEYREGKGLIVFCQLDVTGRSESDPAATVLTRNLLGYVSAWKPSPTRKAMYVGDDAGKGHLEKSGIALGAFDAATLSSDQVLIVGTGGGAALAAHAPAIAAWLKAGGNLLALGIDEAEANAFLPAKVSMTKAEHIATVFPPQNQASGLAGVGPADVHNRSPRELPLVSGGATIVGNGVLARAGNAVICQMVPWHYPYTTPQMFKRTFRRTSCLVSRLLANMGVAGTTPIIERFKSPVDVAKKETRWMDGLYLDQPEEWDYPYRFFRW